MNLLHVRGAATRVSDVEYCRAKTRRFPTCVGVGDIVSEHQFSRVFAVPVSVHPSIVASQVFLIV